MTVLDRDELHGRMTAFTHDGESILVDVRLDKTVHGKDAGTVTVGLGWRDVDQLLQLQREIRAAIEDTMRLAEEEAFEQLTDRQAAYDLTGGGR